jgi:hypothetical protein
VTKFIVQITSYLIIEYSGIIIEKFKKIQQRELSLILFRIIIGLYAIQEKGLIIMISKNSSIIILDLLDKRIDEVNEKIAKYSEIEGEENLVIRLKDVLQNFIIAKDELKKEMERW